MDLQTEMAAEQAHLDRAYERLDVMVDDARRFTADARLEGGGGTFAARVERDVREAVGMRRLAELRLGSLRLCFGRIDRAGGEVFHIGRVAVHDEHQEPLVVDWRAPVAEPFYGATPGDRMGVVRRRHLLTRGRVIVGIDDEMLDLGGGHDGDGVVLVGEAALLDSLARSRTGRMGDIVATIQAEQDRIIRAPLGGIVVVQGGPGTGKTAVALHRAAYLLYTHRFPLERQGVLVVGPNPVFLRYIERVLPSLGETGCQLATTSGLVPWMTTSGTDSSEAAAVKGDRRMVAVVAAAVRSRERAIPRSVDVAFGRFFIRFRRSASAEIVGRVKGRGGAHNARRSHVERLVVEHLFAEYQARRARASRIGGQEPDSGSPDSGSPDSGGIDLADFRAQIMGTPEVRAALERMWPVLSPDQLLHDLFGSLPLLREAGDGILAEHELAALHRPRQSSPAAVPWTDADVPLIDEAAVLLGGRAKRRRARRPAEDFDLLADRVIESVKADDKAFLGPSVEAEIRRRYARQPDTDHADGDGPAVTYGHVVIDEAQDLSPMQLRMLARRCPSGSMTIVGDLGQANTRWAPRTWDEVLAHLPARRSTLVELTVNYRTPAEVMELAARVLATERPDLRPPRSVRAAGVGPRFVRAEVEGLVATVTRVVAEESAAVGEGKVGVIVARRHLAGLAGLAGSFGAQPVGGEPVAERGTDVLAAPVTVLTIDRAKGLEFDAVVVVEPGALVREHPHGGSALYVATTRTTTRLAVVHAEPLPGALLSSPPD